MADKFKYVIIGNGAAGINALESIRRVDRVSPAAIISAESERAHSRTLLPYYVEGKIEEEKIFIRSEDYYQRMNTKSILGRVARVDFKANSVSFEDGWELQYEKLLLATGAIPSLPPVKGLDREKVFTLWTLNDARNIISASADVKAVAIIGAGLIGVQASHALSGRNIRFTIIDIADQILPRILDPEGARLVQGMVESDRVKIITGATITKIAYGTKGYKHSLHVKGMNKVDADLIIVGTGARPNISFLQGSGLAMDVGVLVNSRMETSVHNVYAAGDMAQGQDTLTGELVVRGIWTTAAEQGSIAGYNMAGRPIEYQGSLSTNVVEFFGVTIASVGQTGSTEGYDVETFMDGTGFTCRKVFIRDGVVRGAVFIGRYSDAGIMQWLVRMKANVNSWKGTLANQPINMGKVMLGIQEVELGPHWPLPVKSYRI